MTKGYWTVKQELIATIQSRLPQELQSALLPVGGKLNRARLILAATLLGGKISPVAIKLASGIELLHWASLIHDDILDNATLRRNKASINRKFGVAAAILLGDWFFSEAYRKLRGCPPVYTQALNRVVNTMVAGELGQVLAQRRGGSNSFYLYLRYIARKTAVFFEACLRMGGMAAGLPEGAWRRLGRAGFWWGISYQLSDDLADLLQSKAILGKSIQCDQRKGLITLPLILLAAVEPQALKDLADINQVNLMNLLERHNIIRSCLAVRDRCQQKARGYLLSGGGASIGGEYLVELLDRSLGEFSLTNMESKKA